MERAQAAPASAATTTNGHPPTATASAAAPPRAGAPTLPAPKRPDVAPDSRIFNRDLSWLEFNRRVLQLALDEKRALLERVKFLAIFSSNLDEFVMKRVGFLKRRLTSGYHPTVYEPWD